MLTTYPSSAVRLARLALDRDVSLAGLTVHLLGEPATVGRRQVVERTGASTIAAYAFMQLGVAGYSCPGESAERYDITEDKVAVISRRRPREDGHLVDAFLWTSLAPTTRGVFINVENDDYGAITYDESPCSCLYGQLGYCHRVADVRGMSKVVAGGVTVRGEVFERLVDQVLPAAMGGTPLDYQFAEVDDREHGTLVVRVDPRMGEIDTGRVLQVIREQLRRDEVGRLASQIWDDSQALRVERATPVAARSGKTFAYEPLSGGTAAPAPNDSTSV